MNNWMTLFVLGCVLGALVFVQACDSAEVIPLLGLDRDGKHAQTYLAKAEYLKRVRDLSQTISDAALPGLAQESETSWRLRSMTVGVGVSAQVGIGPISVGAYPIVRVTFSNTKDLTVP